MALTPQQIDDAAAIVGGAASVRLAAASLRERFPDMRATVVDALDMRGEQPAWQQAGRAIFLMRTDGHCWNVTGNPSQASAFVLTGA